MGGWTSHFLIKRVTVLKIKWFAILIYGFITLITPVHSFASIVINGTRVIYSGGEKEATVKLSNMGKSPILVQSWIDDGDMNAAPNKIAVPFILTPPMNRIDADKSQTLRLRYTALPALPEDRESVYWLNVLEIPPLRETDSPNRLQIAFRTRIKLFYRPNGINNASVISEAGENIRWTINNGKLQAENTSPYYISLVSVLLGNLGDKGAIEGKMIEPMSVKLFENNIPTNVKRGSKVTYEYINDWGAVNKAETEVR